VLQIIFDGIKHPDLLKPFLGKPWESLILKDHIFQYLLIYPMAGEYVYSLTNLTGKNL